MDIGIIGSGHIGSILARRLAALGHQVRIANRRGPESPAALAAETGATASTVEQAASAPDVVIVTIPQKAVPELARGLFAGSRPSSWTPATNTRRATGVSTRSKTA